MTTPGRIASPLTASADEYERLKTQTELFRLVGQSAADGLCILRGNIFVDCNPALERMFGRSRDKIVGRTPWQIGARDPKAAEGARLVGEEYMERAYAGDPVRFEWEHITTDHQLRIHDVAMTRFDLTDGPRLFCWVRDVTDGVLAQRELKRRVDFQAKVDQITNQVVAANNETVGNAITNAIRRLSYEYELERASTWVIDRKLKIASGNMAFGFRRPGGPFQTVELLDAPYIMNYLYSGHRDPLIMPDQLPEDAVKDREYLKQRGLKSCVIFPLSGTGDVLGVSSIGMLTRHREWTQRELSELQLLFQICGMSWLRFVSHQSRTKRQKDLERSQRVAGVGSYEITPAGPGPLTWENARVSQSRQADQIRCSIESDDALEALTARVHPDDKDRVRAGLQSPDFIDGSPPLEYRILKSSGEIVYVEDRCEVDRDANGNMVRVFGTVKDVTAQVLARHDLQKALDEIQVLKDKLQAENVILREEVRAALGFDRIIGNSEAMRRSLSAAEKVAPTDVTALILGETGTGKELVARAIHEISNRHEGPLVSVNCAAMTSSLIESELFGHERGAFTDAVSSRKGRFELADGGTLFLDEIGELPLDVQAKLLRVLQTGEFERLGGTETIKVDVRVIAATNRDLQEMVGHGEFRADLYYRINQFPIELSPLRERREDIPELANHFLTRHAAELGSRVTAISDAMLEDMMTRDWPGNVRELEAHIQRAIIGSSTEVLDYRPAVQEQPVVITDMALVPGRGPAAAQASEPDTDEYSLEGMQRRHITAALEQCGWVVDGADGAASVLGLPASSLRSKMKRLGIRRPAA